MNADWGGVVMITEDVMNTVNGYSNLFWGWGKEDGDMATRIRKAGFQVAERNGTGLDLINILLISFAADHFCGSSNDSQ